jgi:uncharacterized protein YfaS (alpha-2-macroglobulin family)
VCPDGSAEKGQRTYRAQLYHIGWSYVLRRSGARNRYMYYEWTRHENRVKRFEGRIADGKCEVEVTPTRAGQHRLIVESDEACPAVADFYVDGPGAQWAMEDPEELQLSLDRKSYGPGETARLSVRGPFGGSVLLCAERDSVLYSRVQPMEGGQATFEFTVQDSWRPNVFLTATVVRPVESEEKWRPHRASGTVCLKVDTSDRRIRLAVAAPGEVRPSGDLEISVRATNGGQPQPGAAVVLAAVDEGVLGLTRYRTPDPLAFFYAPRRLEVLDYDMFSRLAPDLLRWKLLKPARPGGGVADGDHLGSNLARRLSPVQAKRVKTAVLYAGKLLTDEDGVARARFKVPEYVGELRIMATAARGRCFGSLAKPLKVRSPLMVKTSWPRFLSPGDEFELPLTVFNRTGASGEVKLNATLSGPVEMKTSLPIKVDVPAGKQRTVRLELKAVGAGKVKGRVFARLGAESFTSGVELPVRPACPLTRRAGCVTLKAGETTTVKLPGDLLPKTARCSLVVAGSPLVELSGALDYLMTYPYGCVEQTTSRIVPLIYLRDLASMKDPEMVGEEEVAKLLKVGFNRLQMMQTYSGGLSMWPGGGSPYDWGSVYAADILTEARKAGHRVPEGLLKPLLGYLQSQMEHWSGGGFYRQATAAYASYVLARNGRAPHAWMARLDEKLSAEKAPVTARFHLAAAYLAAGQGKVARRSLKGLKPSCQLRQTGGYLDSPTREAAVMLSVLLDVNPGSPSVPRLANKLRKGLRLGRWGTTQENSFALMALGKHAREAGNPGEVSGTLVLSGGRELKFEGRRGLSLKSLKPGQSIAVRTTGRGKTWIYWNAEGVPADGRVPEADHGLSVRRRFLGRDGKPVPGNRLKQGELYRVRLTVSTNRTISNVVISDLLPAGVEIENPHLKGSAAARGDEKARGLIVEHVERRDDRLLLFAKLDAGKASYTYLVRAVTCGRFALAPVECSCMYDPDTYSVDGRGRLEVTR